MNKKYLTWEDLNAADDAYSRALDEIIKRSAETLDNAVRLVYYKDRLYRAIRYPMEPTVPLEGRVVSIF